MKYIMENELVEIFKKNLIQYNPEHLNEKNIEKIYNLFKNNILYDPVDNNECYYLAQYYFINHDLVKSIENYYEAAKNGHGISLKKVIFLGGIIKISYFTKL